MYETSYGLRAKPFTLLPDPEFLFLGTHHTMAMRLLEYGLANGSTFVVITGEPGTGKTTLLNRLLGQSRHQWTIGVLSNTHGRLSGLMPWIVASFGLDTKDKNEVDLFHEFSRFLEREQGSGRRVLLVLDEAQNVGALMLEELRLLSNLNDGQRRSLHILLSGQPGLRDLLVGPGMVQFAQRIGVEYTLERLSDGETVAYIRHRLQVAGRRSPLFTTLAGRVIFRLTGGIPRLINQLCDHALVYGYAAQTDRITARIVLDAAVARNRHGILPFVNSPLAVELSQGELDDEQAEVESFKTENIQIDKQTKHSKAGGTKDFSVLYREAVALKDAGEYVKAAALLDTLVEQEAWATKALAQKGLCLKAIGRYDEALTTIRAALGRPSVTQEESVSLRYLLARTLEAKGRCDEAVEVYRTLERGQHRYRDVSARLARLNQTEQGGRSTGGKEITWFGAFWRECGQLLRGT